nr:hypothetical protein [uncultured Mucilaginibacter sp.]
MEINYTIAGLIVFVALIVIFLLVRKNQKDEKQFEKDMNQQGTEPEKHDRDEERI